MHRKVGSLAAILFLFCSACSPLEIASLFGMGTKTFRAKGKVYSLTVNKSFTDVYDAVLESFGRLKVNFYRGRRRDGFLIFTNFNVSFPQASESTEVAVFLREAGPDKTQVEVSSLNHSLSEFAAQELFRSLGSE